MQDQDVRSAVTENISSSPGQGEVAEPSGEVGGGDLEPIAWYKTIMGRLPHNRISIRTRLRAKSLRHSMTDEEVLLWIDLKGLRRSGYAFRKQAPVGPFIADFLCRKAKLIVEVDGRHHDQAKQLSRDQSRDEWLSRNGYRVLRYSAREIWQDREGVLAGIEAALRLQR